MKRQAKDWDKIFAKDLIKDWSKIYKELLKLNSKEQTTWLNNEPKTLTDASLKKIYKWQINIWKDVPHHMLSGKYKLKEQWYTTIH